MPRVIIEAWLTTYRIMAVGLLVGTLACDGGAQKAAYEARVRRWPSDSAAYEAVLARFLRDSAVIDSLSRAIDTDSLDRLYAALRADPGSQRVKEATLCELMRLSQVHGLAPATVAIDRARERRGPLPPSPGPRSELLTPGESCILPPARTDTVGSESLRYLPRRPAAPLRP